MSVKKTRQNILKYHPDIEFIEVEVDKERMHMVIRSKHVVSDAVNSLTVNSVRRRKKKCVFLKKVYGGADSILSTGYFVSTVGVDEMVIRNYAKQQGREGFEQTELEL